MMYISNTGKTIIIYDFIGYQGSRLGCGPATGPVLEAHWPGRPKSRSPRDASATVQVRAAAAVPSLLTRTLIQLPSRPGSDSPASLVTESQSLAP